MATPIPRPLARADIGLLRWGGMYGKAILADVKANPKKYEDRLNANNKVKAKTGHGGEPFFGQDKFDVFFWRLARNGLTRKDGAAMPSFSWTG